jgi:5-methylcytosine-specific restriction endonuclease McrA
MPLLKLCSGCGGTDEPRNMRRGRCPSCYHEWERERNSRPQHRVWNAAPWRRARDAAKARDGHRCTALENGHRCESRQDLTVHHVVPLAQGGEMYDLANLVTLCRSHHGALEGMKTGRAGGSS